MASPAARRTASTTPTSPEDLSSPRRSTGSRRRARRSRHVLHRRGLRQRARRVLPGNVKLTPILGNAQKYIKKEEGLDADEAVLRVPRFAFSEDIREAIDYGVIKTNIDTDTQWSFWDGVKGYVEENKDTQGQIGNPGGPRPTSTTIRGLLREAENATMKRLLEAYEDLNAIDALSK